LIGKCRTPAQLGSLLIERQSGTFFVHGTAGSVIEPERMVVHTGEVIQMDDEHLFRFCQINRDLQIERNADGDIIITAPEGGSSGKGAAS